MMMKLNLKVSVCILLAAYPLLCCSCRLTRSGHVLYMYFLGIVCTMQLAV